MQLGAVTVSEMPAVEEPLPESLPPPVEEPAPEPPADLPEVFPEGSGPVLEGVREGTGPLLDMLLKEGTGPVVDTPFFRDVGVGPLVPAMSDAPFVSSRSSLSALAIPPPQPTAPAPELNSAAAPEPAPAPSGEALPDWLRTEPSVPSVNLPPLAASNWTGALDHLMPSKLVVGLTKVLLARGLVTEEEILAALGQKK